MARKKKLKIEGGKIGKRKQEREMKLVVIFMIVLVAFIFIFYWLSLEMKKFSYAGLEFAKTKQGKLNLYLAKFPLQDINGDIIDYTSVYFREDPRKLSRIKINDKIEIKNNLAIAAETGSLNCEDTNVATTTFFIFLARNGIDPFIATTNETLAYQMNKTYINCNNNLEDYSAIVFRIGEESRIAKDGNCYVLSINNCEIMNVTERFMLGMFANPKGIEI